MLAHTWSDLDPSHTYLRGRNRHEGHQRSVELAVHFGLVPSQAAQGPQRVGQWLWHLGWGEQEGWRQF